MNRLWINLVVAGLIIVLAIAGWDLFLTVTGNKAEFEYTLTPIENRLFGKVEEHLRADDEFADFQRQIDADQ